VAVDQFFPSTVAARRVKEGELVFILSTRKIRADNRKEKGNLKASSQQHALLATLQTAINNLFKS